METKLNVLYVEDEPNIAKLLASGLSLFGIEVFPAFVSAEELLEKTGDHEYAEADILIFDIRLPRMTGMELAAELRARGEKRPIVLVSAWPAPTRDQLDKIGAKFLPKLFAFPDVVQTVQRLARQNRD